MTDEQGNSYSGLEHVRRTHNVAVALSRIEEQLENERTIVIEKKVRGLKEDGARPYRVFNEIIGEMTRADNIGCGINMVVDHSVISRYLREEASGESGRRRELYEWLAEEGDFVSDSREVVLEFLLLDQLTSANIYEMNDDNTFGENDFLESSIEEYAIPNRVMPDSVKTDLLERLKHLKEVASSWEKKRKEFQERGKEVLDYIKNQNLSDEQLQEIIKRGSFRAETQNWLLFITNLENSAETMIQLLNEEGLDSEKIRASMYNFMLVLTGAQAILEFQYFYVGLGSIRKVMSNPD